MLERIVVGVDGTSHGRDAIALGTRLAALTDAPVTLVYAYAPGSSEKAGARLTRAAQEEAAWRIVDAEARFGPPRSRTAVAAGINAAVALRAFAVKEAADLLVVGAGRHGRVGRVLLGGVPRALLRAPPCAVAVAPHGYAAQPQPASLTIGVGLDGSRSARCGLELAEALAVAAHGRLRIVAPAGAASSWDPREGASRTAQRLVEEAVIAVRVPARGEVCERSAATALLELSGDCDVMVIGARPPGGRARLHVGDAGDTLVRHALCPVIVVPSRAGGLQEAARSLTITP